VIQHQGMVEVSVEGRTIPGPWTHKSGGQSNAESNRYYPGHMLPAVTYGGPPTRENIVLRRLDDLPQDLSDWLDSQCGAGASTVTFIKLDRRKRPWRRHPYTGTLLRYEPAEYNAESNDNAEVEFEFSADGP
jgi:hypothetical protein